MRLLAESERCISSDLERCAARFRRAAAWLALGMGIIVLAGWLLGVRTMQSFVPGWVTMKPNAAASLAAAGGALLLLEGAHTGGAWVRARLGVSRALGIVVALVGLLTLAEYLFAVDLGIDQLLFAASGDALTANPGRMAALTAAALAPLGFALVAATVSPPISHRVVQPLAFASGALALAALLGHLYGAIPVAGDGNGIQIAMHTAFGILLLSAATITVDTSRGWLPALFSPRPGGVLARRLLPVVLCIPIALGALRMTGEWFHIGGAMTASATVAVITMFTFGLVIWHTARALDIADAQWRAADRERVGLALSEAAARARADSEAAARRSAERVVREREEALALLDLVLDSSPVAFGLLDTDLRFRRVNPALAAFNGAPAADHIGRTVSHMLPDRGEAVEASCRQVLATGIPLTSAESVSTAPGAGRQRQWLSSTFPIPSSTGGMHGLGVMIIETTERRALEAQLHQAQKMEAVGQLAGGVAHDFNNLLTAIRSFSELAMLELPHDSPARSDVAEIALAADRASALTRQLLAFSRRQILQPVVLDPNDVVTGVTRLLARLIGPDIHCQPVLSKDAGHILADRGQLEQVIVNLAVNARDAMPHGGVLTIETANITVDERHAATLAGTEPPVPGDYVVLAVSDTGVGMDGETLGRIFDPFFTTKPAGEGTGLGLSTVYGIVRQSHGFVSVYSEVGRGTTFRVHLPRTGSRITLPARSPAARGDSRTGSPGQTVLVVDDDAAVRAVAKRILERAGYRVLSAVSAAEAESVWASHDGPIDLLMTDLMMPDTNGADLAKLFIAARPQSRVLYTSGYTGENVVRRGLIAGDASFLAKPFSIDDALAKVHQALTTGGRASI